MTINTQCPIILWLSITLLSCAPNSMKVDAEKPVLSVFANLHTYSWAPRNGKSRDPQLENDKAFHLRVQNAIDQQMQAKGFVTSNTSTPDFWIDYTGKLNKMTETELWTSQYRPRLSIGNPGTINYVYEEGELSIEFIDPSSQNSFWRGVAKDKISYSPDPATRDNSKLNRAIKQILAPIPKR